MKAVIVDVKDSKFAVMTADGRFIALDPEQLMMLTGDDGLISAAGTGDGADGGNRPETESFIGREIILPDTMIEADSADADDEDELFDTGFGAEGDDLDEDELFDDELNAAAGKEAAGAREPVEEEQAHSGVDIIDISKRQSGRTGGHRGSRRLMKAVSSVAAAAVLMVAVGGAYTYAQPYGVVSLDVNPSIEYTINRFDRVLSAEAVNEDGAEVLDSLDLRSIRNRSIGDAISETLTQIGDAELVVVGANTRSEAHSERLTAKLEAELAKDLHGDADDVETTFYLSAVSDEEAAEAKLLGTTPGRLHFAQLMLAGTEVPAEDADPESETGSTANGANRVNGSNSINGVSGTNGVNGSPAAADALPASDNGDWLDWSRRPVMEIKREHDRRMGLKDKGYAEGNNPGGDNNGEGIETGSLPESGANGFAPDSIGKPENAGEWTDIPDNGPMHGQGRKPVMDGRNPDEALQSGSGNTSSVGTGEGVSDDTVPTGVGELTSDEVIPEWDGEMDPAGRDSAGEESMHPDGMVPVGREEMNSDGRPSAGEEGMIPEGMAPAGNGEMIPGDAIHAGNGEMTSESTIRPEMDRPSGTGEISMPEGGSLTGRE